MKIKSVWEKIESNEEKRKEVRISPETWDEILTILSQGQNPRGTLTMGKYGKSLKVVIPDGNNKEITIFLTVYSNGIGEEKQEEEF